jgi:outer membrane protein assembly factor BamA
MTPHMGAFLSTPPSRCPIHEGGPPSTLVVREEAAVSRTLISSLFALLVGCSGSYANGPPPAADAEHLVELRFDGNHGLSDDDVRSALTGARDGVRVRRDQFDRGILMLTSAYYDRGYIFVEASVEGTPDAAVVHIAEGDRYRVASVDVFELDSAGERSAVLPAAAAAAPELGTAAGTWFNRRAVTAAIERLRAAYRDAGYPSVAGDPETEVDRVHGVVRIRLGIQRGRRTQP